MSHRQGTRVVRLGVTGHRFLADIEKLAAAVNQAICGVERAFPRSTLAVLSPLAEGADRLVARRVLARPGARLVAVLPLPRQDYIADFRTAESREEFLDLLGRADEVVELAPAATREAAYEAAGRYILDHCDVLIALWDGQLAQGQGGTGSVVAEAQRRGLPLAWVHAGNREPGTEESTSLGEEQGQLTMERFPAP